MMIATPHKHPCGASQNPLKLRKEAPRQGGAQKNSHIPQSDSFQLLEQFLRLIFSFFLRRPKRFCFRLGEEDGFPHVLRLLQHSSHSEEHLHKGSAGSMGKAWSG